MTYHDDTIPTSVTLEKSQGITNTNDRNRRKVQAKYTLRSHGQVKVDSGWFVARRRGYAWCRVSASHHEP